MPRPAVIPALVRVIRGLSALFWGLPLVLLLDIKTALSESWQSWGLFPVVFAACLLVFGLLELRRFQPDERIWISALERAQVLSLFLLALAPVTYWWNRSPEETFFAAGVSLLPLAGITFLLALNQVLLRLSAMLPDETLRSETRFFVRLNNAVLFCLLLLVPLALAWHWSPLFRGRTLSHLTTTVGLPAEALEQLLHTLQIWFLLLLVLVPVALTMTLLWKTKEVILLSTFRAYGEGE